MIGGERSIKCQDLCSTCLRRFLFVPFQNMFFLIRIFFCMFGTIQIDHFLSLYYYVSLSTFYLNISHKHEKLADVKSFKAGVRSLLGTWPHSKRWSASERSFICHSPSLPITPHRSHYHLNHSPLPPTVEKLSSVKLVPGAKRVGDRCFKFYKSVTNQRSFKVHHCWKSGS